MTNKIKDAFARIEASEELKSSTMRLLRSEREKRSRRVRQPAWRKALAVSCAVLALLIGIGGYYTVQAPVAYVSIDVNPSLELALNRYDRVVSAIAYNEDGKIVLDGIDVRGKLYTDAIDSIVDSPAMQPYLTDTAALTFTVAAGDSNRENAILAGIKRCSGCQRHGGQSYAADVDSIAKAHDSGLSLGKYAAYLVLSQYDSSITTEDCRNMSMAEIRREISKYEGGNWHNGNSSSNTGGKNRRGAASSSLEDAGMVCADAITGLPPLFPQACLLGANALPSPAVAIDGILKPGYNGFIGDASPHSYLTDQEDENVLGRFAYAETSAL